MEHEQCDACGFNGAAYDDAALLEGLRDLGPRWAALLRTAGPHLRTRPAHDVWSALEYAAHSRDVTALHVFGVNEALTLDEPVLPAIAGDELVEAAVATYEGADPDEVVAQLNKQATALADAADQADRGLWSHGITIGEDRSDVRRLLEHALHDSVHHLGDVEAGLAGLSR